MTMAERLIEINGCKRDIRAAINEKGVHLSEQEAFAAYAGKIRLIEGGGSTGGGGGSGVVATDIVTITYVTYHVIDVLETADINDTPGVAVTDVMAFAYNPDGTVFPVNAAVAAQWGYDGLWVRMNPDNAEFGDVVLANMGELYATDEGGAAYAITFAGLWPRSP